MNHEQRFPIGTVYKAAGKHGRTCRVIDYLTTRNLAGEIVRTEYVTEHEFCGQMITETVCETTVARGVWRLESGE